MKTVKNKLTFSIILFIVGIICLLVLFLTSKLLGEYLFGYLSGFAICLIVIEFLMIIKYTRISKNKELVKKIENTKNDERLKQISNAALAITFRISIFAEVIISIIYAVIGKTEISQFLGLAVCIQIIISFLTYYIICEKN